MILEFIETDGVTGNRLTIGQSPINDGDVLIRSGRKISGTSTPVVVNLIISGSLIIGDINGINYRFMVVDGALKLLQYNKNVPTGQEITLLGGDL